MKSHPPLPFSCLLHPTHILIDGSNLSRTKLGRNPRICGRTGADEKTSLVSSHYHGPDHPTVIYTTLRYSALPIGKPRQRGGERKRERERERERERSVTKILLIVPATLPCCTVRTSTPPRFLHPELVPCITGVQASSLVPCRSVGRARLFLFPMSYRYRMVWGVPFWVT